jgi:hypothetical protein
MIKRIYLYPGQGEGQPHYLDSVGTIQDLVDWGITLSEGLRMGFYDFDANDRGDDDKLIFDGTVHYDATKGKWYAIIDWSSFRHESEERTSSREM